MNAKKPGAAVGPRSPVAGARTVDGRWTAFGLVLDRGRPACDGATMHASTPLGHVLVAAAVLFGGCDETKSSPAKTADDAEKASDASPKGTAKDPAKHPAKDQRDKPTHEAKAAVPPKAGGRAAGDEDTKAAPATPSPGGAPTPLPAAPDDTASSPSQGEETAHDDGAPKAAPDPTLSGPLKFDPTVAGDGKLPHDNFIESIGEGSFASHVHEFGWNASSTEFMYCVRIGGGEYDTCTYVGLDGKVQSLDGDEPGSTVMRTFEARRKRFGAKPNVGPKTWAYGKDITITWKADGARYHLMFGGKLASGEGKHDIIRAKFDPELIDGGDMWPELVSVAPDGQHIVLLAHGSLGEIETSLFPFVWRSGDFAAAVYAGAAWKNFKAKRFAPAADLFAKASDASAAWKHPYNLACARALGGLADVEAALKLAIERGGASVKTKAAKDADLTSVRGEAWFTGLVSG